MMCVVITGRSSRLSRTGKQPRTYLRFSWTNFCSRAPTSDVPLNKSLHKPCRTTAHESVYKSCRSCSTWNKRRLLQVWDSGRWCVLSDCILFNLSIHRDQLKLQSICGSGYNSTNYMCELFHTELFHPFFVIHFIEFYFQFFIW